jgi:NADPH:quinone reductase-like Zn-dependent oxidoreductase
MTGRPYAARLAFGLRRPKNPVPGLDLSGRIVAIGPGVDQLAVGDEVFGAGNGSCAEYAVAAADRLTAKPAAWSWTEAAAAAVSGVTAWQAVHTAGRAVPGQRVLVLGASGGVGSFAVQIATAAGAAVTGVSSSAKTGFVRALGADEAIGYEDAKLSERDPFDLVLDIGGGRSIAELRRLTAPDGTIVIVGAESGGALLGGVGRSIGGALRSPFLRQRIVMLASAVRQRELAELAELGRDGRLTPAVDPHRFTLDDAAVAMNLLVAGGQRGKIVLRIGSEALSER